ncbi:MAG: formylglycine-generating enzyme family protein [Gemmataceae bacterium]
MRDTAMRHAAWLLFILSTPVMAQETGSLEKPIRAFAERLPGTDFVLEMLPIPGGVYARGSTQREKGHRDDELPPHPVRIEPFWMSRTEVPWDLYDLFLLTRDDAKRKLGLKPDIVSRPSPPYVDPTWGYGHKGFPVIGVSHHAAMEFCRWLSAQTGKAYRLPTEAEWEYAARAGTTTAFFFGDDPARLGEFAWFGANSEEAPHPVGKKKPNPWGLCDIYGNVAEWCLDQYDRKAYPAFAGAKAALNPVTLPTAASYPHVLRGGSWADHPSRCRSAARGASDPGFNRRDPERPQSIWWLSDADFVGFRVVVAVEKREGLKGIRSKVTRGK